MQQLVFVYGTLKQGFCNFDANGGTRLPGEYQALEAYPLYIIGPGFLPWLVDMPGEGYRVVGQLFEIGDAALAEMDAFEETSRPNWYRRGKILVCRRGDSDAQAISAQVYYGSRSRMRMETIHDGPVAVYTHVHQASYSEEDTI